MKIKRTRGKSTTKIHTALIRLRVVFNCLVHFLRLQIFRAEYGVLLMMCSLSLHTSTFGYHAFIHQYRYCLFLTFFQRSTASQDHYYFYIIELYSTVTGWYFWEMSEVSFVAFGPSKPAGRQSTLGFYLYEETQLLSLYPTVCC
jgi:hypothetical protein